MDTSSEDEAYEDLAEILDSTVRIRKEIVLKTNPLDHLSERETLQRFRFCKQAIHDLLEILLSNNSLKAKGPFSKTVDISPMIQLLVGLRFFATGNFQLSNGDLHTVSQSSVSKIIRRVSHGIASLHSTFIKYPTFEEAILIRRRFMELGNFPGIVGCIDCTHIKIRSPGGPRAELFRNRKRYFSINVQAVCDADMKFTNCIARWPGSVHDSRIFDSSLLRAQLGDNEIPGNLVGDGGYSSMPYLFTPIEKPTTVAERRYNKHQIKTRNPIERSFGLLKRRFYCLGSELRTKLSTSLSIIVACFVLHNYAINCNMELPEEDYEIIDNQPEAEPSRSTSSPSGLAIRRTFINTHFNY